MVISWSFSSKNRWRRNTSPSTVILNFLSTIFIPCSSVGFADCLAVFLLVVCLKKNLLLDFMLLMICFSNLLGLTFCFSHLTCQRFCSFLFSLSGTASASWILLWNCGQNGDWLIYQALAMDSVSCTSTSVGRRVPLTFHVAAWGSGTPQFPNGWEPWAWPGCFWMGNSSYCSAASAVATSATQSKGQQIKKKKKKETLC